MPKWVKYGGGAFNTAYISEDRKELLKIQKITRDCTDKYDTPERSVRLWNEINAHISPKAYMFTDPLLGKGWVCPFIEGRQSTDQEISSVLIDIYNKHGRIIVDATASRNFITTDSGTIFCVDIGQALELERREKGCFIGGRARKKSIISLELWEEIEPWRILSKSSRSHPLTTKMIKALLFIKKYQPDLFEVSFLKTSLADVEVLALAVDTKVKQSALALINQKMMTQCVLSSQYNPSFTKLLTSKEQCNLALSSKSIFRETQSTRDAHILQKFIVYVVQGEQDKAERLLAIPSGTPSKWLLGSAECTDYSGRTFHCTAYEYAYWAKDWHMCRMLQGYMNEESKAEMLIQADAIDRNGLHYTQRGERKNSKHFSFRELKDAYKNYLEIYKRWRAHTATDTELDVAWFAIGRVQRDVPAYVAQEYCRTDRTFLPQPTFGEETFPRTLMFYHCGTGRNEFWFSSAASDTSGLGYDFTAFRGSCDIVMASISRSHGRSTLPPTGMGCWNYAEVDFHAINALDTLSMYLIDSLRKKLKPLAVRFTLP